MAPLGTAKGIANKARHDQSLRKNCLRIPIDRQGAPAFPANCERKDAPIKRESPADSELLDAMSNVEICPRGFSISYFLA